MRPNTFLFRLSNGQSFFCSIIELTCSFFVFCLIQFEKIFISVESTKISLPRKFAAFNAIIFLFFCHNYKKFNFQFSFLIYSRLSIFRITLHEQYFHSTLKVHKHDTQNTPVRHISRSNLFSVLIFVLVL